MHTMFACAPDGIRIAYDQRGVGPAVILVHGGGGSRQEWHELGYVARLQDDFTVITLDLRGHGQSDISTDPAAYTTDKMGQDILAVADVCDFNHFSLWAMSFGAKISRYLAVQSDRVSKLVMMGAQLGLGVTGQLRQDALEFRAHWPPILEAQRDGTLDLASLSESDREMLENFNIAVILAWVKAMLEWSSVEPNDFRCPTLWLAGSKDLHAMSSIKDYAEAVEDSLVEVQIVPGLDHNQLFEEIDTVLPIMLAFTRK
jgi:pimeloyl-ACP methyl ester carboxylesterase